MSPPTEIFATFHTDLQAAALKATKASACLPIDLAFYKSVDEDLKTNVDHLESRVLALIGRCIALANGKGKGKEVSVDGEDVIDDFHSTVVDSVDILLEKTDICLDEYSGKLKRPVAPPAASTSASSTKKIAPQTNSQAKPYLPASLQHASGIPKPQLAFPNTIDNSDNVPPPHVRFLKHKYNARLPLGYVLQKEDILESFSGADMEVSLLPSHPYYFEITHLEHPPHVFIVPPSPSEPSPLPSPLTYVSTSSQFSDLLAHLASPEVQQIAVDLEHHSYRTYRGFLCLMQITTRKGDFIVDLLSPEVRARAHELNEVFTDPTKIKIFHGAESDIVWLQQDFGIYVVGLFDTFHASKLLDLPRHSLSTLLELYADYTPDKKYQLADWRIRPLPQEMLDYAQSDTHWLLYLYDRLRSALLDKEASRSNSNPTSRQNSRPGSPNNATAPTRSLLQETLFRSSQTSLRQYIPEIYDAQRGSGPGGWDSLAKKWNKGSLLYLPSDDDETAFPGGVQKVQRLVYRAVHQWRDSVSREEDESTRYVLPNHFLFTLAETPPADMGALLGMFRGGAGVPPVVKKRAKGLLAVVKDAVRKGLEGPSTNEAVVVEKQQDMDVDEKVEDVAHVKEGAEVQKDNRIWGTTATTSLVASSSTLLGRRPDASNTGSLSQSISLSTSKSALFGSSLSSKSVASLSGSSKPADNPTFRTLVSKINSTLVIAPSVITALSLPSSSSTTQNAVAATTEGTTAPPAEKQDNTTTFDPALGMQIDSHPIAYVPATQRASTTTSMAGMEDMGPIVVVGRKGNSSTANRKKRKRDAAALASADPAPVGEVEGESTSPAADKATVSASSSVGKVGSAGKSDNAEADAPYDFAGTSNVLDKGPVKKKMKGGKKSEGKKAGGKEAQPKGAGDFGAPPKSRSDFKGGNKSCSFK